MKAAAAARCVLISSFLAGRDVLGDCSAHVGRHRAATRQCGFAGTD
jgi:hypothetical protein